MNAVRNWLIRYRVALIVGLVVLLAIISFRIVNGLTEYRLVVPLDSADGLYPGSDVLIAGAKAGSVQDITLDGNQTLVYGRQDLDHLAAITDTLAARDQDLQKVIQGLDAVTAELAQSDRRQELGALIHNSEVLLHSLSQQDSQIKATLANANAALSRSDASLSGTAAQLNDIFRQAPATVNLLNGITRTLATNTDLVVA